MSIATRYPELFEETQPSFEYSPEHLQWENYSLSVDVELQNVNTLTTMATGLEEVVTQSSSASLESHSDFPSVTREVTNYLRLADVTLEDIGIYDTAVGLEADEDKQQGFFKKLAEFIKRIWETIRNILKKIFGFLRKSRSQQKNAAKKIEQGVKEVKQLSYTVREEKKKAEKSGGNVTQTVTSQQLALPHLPNNFTPPHPEKCHYQGDTKAEALLTGLENTNKLGRRIVDDVIPNVTELAEAYITLGKIDPMDVDELNKILRASSGGGGQRYVSYTEGLCGYSFALKWVNANLSFPAYNYQKKPYDPETGEIPRFTQKQIDNLMSVAEDFLPYINDKYGKRADVMLKAVESGDKGINKFIENLDKLVGSGEYQERYEKMNEDDRLYWNTDRNSVKEVIENFRKIGFMVQRIDQLMLGLSSSMYYVLLTCKASMTGGS